MFTYFRMPTPPEQNKNRSGKKKVSCGLSSKSPCQAPIYSQEQQQQLMLQQAQQQQLHLMQQLEQQEESLFPQIAQQQAITVQNQGQVQSFS